MGMLIITIIPHTDDILKYTHSVVTPYWFFLEQNRMQNINKKARKNVF